MNVFLRIGAVEFPPYQGGQVNMMPIIVGDLWTLPDRLRGYATLIDATGLPRGELAYLTVHESVVRPGETQRRPGAHTDATKFHAWGGGPWGGGEPQPTPPKPPKPSPKPPKPTRGIYMASTDGLCRIWNEVTRDVDSHGGLLILPTSAPTVMEPSVLYWATDRTPHESLPARQQTRRQFFRLVADEIGVWWSKHSTPSPFGVKPNARVVDGDKFSSK